MLNVLATLVGYLAEQGLLQGQVDLDEILAKQTLSLQGGQSA